ncbi:hypothetical protein HWD35_24600 [Tsukamurella tyrosinosolvens]|uniref:DUF7373 family lipoprotein n=1 Tax=Tsukamurella pulmonis TaxID=47312 RepID=UPI001058FC82|nr:hypothetical protein [Tsukamurella pulmonis]MCA4997903.1 hypothetical protein [Tsukamurella tyrosinosolvens]
MHVRVTAALIATALLVTGCTTVAGTAVPEPQAQALHGGTGGLPTAPREATAPGAQRKVLAANTLSDRMVLPTDIDRSLTVGNPQTAVRASNLVALDGLDQDRLAKRGMLYGFSEVREAPDRATSGDGITITLVRMPDEAAAKGAVEDLRTQEKARAVAVPGRDDIPAYKIPAGDNRVFTTITGYAAFGPLLLIASPRSKDEGKLVGWLTKAVDLQRDRLAGFTSPASADLANLPVDKDGIVGLTVTPDRIEPGRFEQYWGFQTRTAQLHWMDDPVKAAALFDEVGMDLVGVGTNAVYRTRDGQAAARMLEQLTKDLAAEAGATAFTIDGLPSAQCRSVPLDTSPYSSATAKHTCYVAVGRYMSAYTGIQLERTRQVTAAAYLVLRSAK